MEGILETEKLILRPVENSDLSLLAEWRGTKNYLEVGARYLEYM